MQKVDICGPFCYTTSSWGFVNGIREAVLLHCISTGAFVSEPSLVERREQISVIDEHARRKGENIYGEIDFHTTPKDPIHLTEEEKLEAEEDEDNRNPLLDDAPVIAHDKNASKKAKPEHDFAKQASILVGRSAFDKRPVMDVPDKDEIGSFYTFSWTGLMNMFVRELTLTTILAMYSDRPAIALGLACMFSGVVLRRQHCRELVFGTSRAGLCVEDSRCVVGGEKIGGHEGGKGWGERDKRVASRGTSRSKSPGQAGGLPARWPSPSHPREILARQSDHFFSTCTTE